MVETVGSSRGARSTCGRRGSGMVTHSGPPKPLTRHRLPPKPKPWMAAGASRGLRLRQCPWDWLPFGHRATWRRRWTASSTLRMPLRLGRRSEKREREEGSLREEETPSPRWTRSRIRPRKRKCRIRRSMVRRSGTEEAPLAWSRSATHLLAVMTDDPRCPSIRCPRGCSPPTTRAGTVLFSYNIGCGPHSVFVDACMYSTFVERMNMLWLLWLRILPKDLA